MAGETLPIVYKGSPRNTLFVLAVGAGLVVAGFYAVQQPMSHMIGTGPRSIEMPAPVAGMAADSRRPRDPWPGARRHHARLPAARTQRGRHRVHGLLARHEADGVARSRARRGAPERARRAGERGTDPARGPTMLVGSLSAPADALRATIEQLAARMKTPAREA